MSRFCSPLRYPGGKNCIFPFVSKLFHENGLIGTAYAEPYAGGAGLALRLLFNEYVEQIYINDLDRSIYAFWVSILENTDSFCDWIENVDVSMESWHQYRRIQNQASTESLFDLAKSTFFLNRTNVSGIIKGGVIGGYDQKGYYKIDARFKKADLIDRIQKIGKFNSRIFVSNLDGLKFLRKIEAKKQEVFIYMDPPYYQKGADLYMNFYTDPDHKKLADQTCLMRKNWMVSYDNHDFIFDLYPDKNKVLYKLSQSASNRVGEELLIFSDKVIFKKSMCSLASSRLANILKSKFT